MFVLLLSLKKVSWGVGFGFSFRKKESKDGKPRGESVWVGSKDRESAGRGTQAVNNRDCYYVGFTEVGGVGWDVVYKVKMFENSNRRRWSIGRGNSTTERTFRDKPTEQKEQKTQHKNNVSGQNGGESPCHRERHCSGWEGRYWGQGVFKSGGNSGRVGGGSSTGTYGHGWVPIEPKSTQDSMSTEKRWE